MIFMGKGVAVNEEDKARAASYYERQPPQVQRESALSCFLFTSDSGATFYSRYYLRQ